jgi:hypothetical protein
MHIFISKPYDRFCSFEKIQILFQIVKPYVGVFHTGKIQGGQDHVFQFRGGLVNNEAPNDLSWFRPLFRGNSPTSSGLILKMNMCYKG